MEDAGWEPFHPRALPRDWHLPANDSFVWIYDPENGVREMCDPHTLPPENDYTGWMWRRKDAAKGGEAPIGSYLSDRVYDGIRHK